MNRKHFPSVKLLVCLNVWSSQQAAPKKQKNIPLTRKPAGVFKLKPKLGQHKSSTDDGNNEVLMFQPGGFISDDETDEPEKMKFDITEKKKLVEVFLLMLSGLKYFH